jgi:hypothetical protein
LVDVALSSRGSGNREVGRAVRSRAEMAEARGRNASTIAATTRQTRGPLANGSLRTPDWVPDLANLRGEPLGCGERVPEVDDQRDDAGPNNLPAQIHRMGPALWHRTPRHQSENDRSVIDVVVRDPYAGGLEVQLSDTIIRTDMWHRPISGRVHPRCGSPRFVKRYPAHASRPVRPAGPALARLLAPVPSDVEVLSRVNSSQHELQDAEGEHHTI